MARPDGAIPRNRMAAGIIVAALGGVAVAAYLWQGGAATSGIGWDPQAKSPNITLSTDDLVAMQMSAPHAWSVVRGREGKSSGKWYFRLGVEAVDSSSGWVGGIANAGAPLDAFLGSDTRSAGFQVGQNFYEAGKTHGAAWTAVKPDGVVDIAVDLDTHKIWARAEGSEAWNASATASPSAGSGGFDIGAINGPLFPAWCGFDGDKPDAARLDVTTALTDRTLAGFSAWGAIREP